jgi:hypothetical protein
MSHTFENIPDPDEVTDQRYERYHDVVFALAMKQVHDQPVEPSDVYNFLEAAFVYGHDGTIWTSSLFELMYAKDNGILTPNLRTTLVSRIAILEYDDGNTLAQQLSFLELLPEFNQLLGTTIVNQSLAPMLLRLFDEEIEKRKYRPLAAKTLAQAMALFED